MQNYLVNSKKSSTFAPAFERKRVERENFALAK
jgi:hypothetical protein